MANNHSFLDKPSLQTSQGKLYGVYDYQTIMEFLVFRIIYAKLVKTMIGIFMAMLQLPDAHSTFCEENSYFRKT